jgi:hypothetical protein
MAQDFIILSASKRTTTPKISKSQSQAFHQVSSGQNPGDKAAEEKFKESHSPMKR